MSVRLGQYRELYFSEAREQLVSVAAALRRLERIPGDKTAFQAAFRAIHSLKGMSATMGYDEITVFAHAFEDLLESARGRSDGSPSPGIHPLFRTLDHLDSLIRRLESGQPPEAEVGAAESAAALPGAAPAPAETASLVRIRFDQLEQVMARTLDLLASANRLAYARANSSEEIAEARWRDHLSLVRQLQAAAWSMEMAPIGDVFNRFPRMLHDLARAQGKEIRVTIDGGEIEVGRAVLDEIAEPLLHLLRNAVAHGIEPLAERLTAGKDPRGTVFLRARQQGDSITVEVGDDGRGLDAQRILQAALEQGLISETERRTLGEAEAYELIMLSGFSLSPVVSKASGRGVGMDIVRNRVQALRGTLHIRSQPGFGTTFILGLVPAFEAIPVELVRVGDRVFAIRAAQIDSRTALMREDLMRLPSGELNVLDRTLRVIDLRSLFGLPPCPDSNSYGLLVINNHIGIAVRVDEFLGKALWSKPPNGVAPAVPLLDLNQLPPA